MFVRYLKSCKNEVIKIRTSKKLKVDFFSRYYNNNVTFIYDSGLTHLKTNVKWKNILLLFHWN